VVKKKPVVWRFGVQGKGFFHIGLWLNRFGVSLGTFRGAEL
jgi:hypothetical protein